MGREGRQSARTGPPEGSERHFRGTHGALERLPLRRGSRRGAGRCPRPRQSRRRSEGRTGAWAPAQARLPCASGRATACAAGCSTGHTLQRGSWGEPVKTTHARTTSASTRAARTKIPGVGSGFGLEGRKGGTGAGGKARLSPPGSLARPPLPCRRTLSFGRLSLARFLPSQFCRPMYPMPAFASLGACRSSRERPTLRRGPGRWCLGVARDSRNAREDSIGRGGPRGTASRKLWTFYAT